MVIISHYEPRSAMCGERTTGANHYVPWPTIFGLIWLYMTMIHHMDNWQIIKWNLLHQRATPRIQSLRNLRSRTRRRTATVVAHCLQEMHQTKNNSCGSFDPEGIRISYQLTTLFMQMKNDGSQQCICSWIFQLFSCQRVGTCSLMSNPHSASRDWGLIVLMINVAVIRSC